MLGAAAACPGLINMIEAQKLLKQKSIWTTAHCLFWCLLGQALIMLGPGSFFDLHHTSDFCLEGPNLSICLSVQEHDTAVCDAGLLLPISP